MAAQGFDEVMIVNPFDPALGESQGVETMRFHLGEPEMGYYAEPPDLGYYAEDPYGEDPYGSSAT